MLTTFADVAIYFNDEAKLCKQYAKEKDNYESCIYTGKAMAWKDASEYLKKVIDDIKINMYTNK